MKQPTANTRPPHVFLSYSRKDVWEMRAIYNEIRLAGFRVWIDDELTPGTPSWQHEIKSMLDAASCVVCLCSPTAYRSKWVNIELELATQREIRIYPLIVRGSRGSNCIPVSLTNVQHIDCRRDYVSSVQSLIDELRRSEYDSLSLELQSIFGGDNELRWTRFGSLFWFASEVRKLRLLLRPESPDHVRFVQSLAQLRHHAARLNVDKFTQRDIDGIYDAMQTTELQDLSHHARNRIEDKLRLVQDKVGALAEEADADFEDGPMPGNPLPP